MHGQIGPAMKLTVFIDGDDRHQHQPLYRAVINLMNEGLVALSDVEIIEYTHSDNVKPAEG